MYKTIIIWLLLSVCSFGLIYPTINGDRSYWWTKVDNTIMIDHPFTLGLTKPDFKSEVDVYFINHNCTIDISKAFVYNGIQLDLSNNILSVTGTYDNVGNILSNVSVSDSGYLEYYVEGTFMAYIMPEPLSLMIYLTGIWFIVRGKK